jgi:hypothetical protein
VGVAEQHRVNVFNPEGELAVAPLAFGAPALEQPAVQEEAKPRDLDEVHRAACFAKLRTGGVKPEAIPAVGDVAAFILACAGRRLPFKATAGLHHPLRGDYRLTYAPDSAQARMFGFLNVFLAAAYARNGLDESELIPLLEETSRLAFQVTDDSISWRGNRLDLAAIRRAREQVVISFGSCSFTEPVSELAELIEGWHGDTFT